MARKSRIQKAKEAFAASSFVKPMPKGCPQVWEIADKVWADIAKNQQRMGIPAREEEGKVIPSEIDAKVFLAELQARMDGLVAHFSHEPVFASDEGRKLLPKPKPRRAKTSELKTFLFDLAKEYQADYLKLTPLKISRLLLERSNLIVSRIRISKDPDHKLIRAEAYRQSGIRKLNRKENF